MDLDRTVVDALETRWSTPRIPLFESHERPCVDIYVHGGAHVHVAVNLDDHVDVEGPAAQR